MFSLWTCLSLIYVLQNSVISDEVVSLTCNQTVNVTVGQNGTLKCFINSALEEACTVLKQVWHNTNGSKLCDRSSKKYICDSDLSYVALNILNVQEEESFTAEIISNCGMAKSHPIRVQLLPGGTNLPPEPIEQKESTTHVTTITLCVFAFVAAVVILYFLYRTYRHRVNGRTYAAPRSEDCLTNSHFC